MDEDERLAEQFEEHRGHLRAVAHRMLGSRSEAEDAVQETWLRLRRTDRDAVENLRAWLTAVAGRVCLNMLRARRTRREQSLDVHESEPQANDEDVDPAEEILLADSVGVALLVVLDILEPAERLAFVLHDLFGMPFEDIAPIVDRSPAAARQLASRARRRVRQAAPASRPDTGRQRELVEAFLAASRSGDLEALLGLLDPGVVLRADRAAVASAAANQAQGAPTLGRELHGQRAVAGAFAGRARGAQPALIDGAIGAAWAPGGVALAAFVFTIVDGKIVAIEALADPEHLRDLELKML